MNATIAHHDFDYRSLEADGHRPWPRPSRRWIMTQSWHDLLFAHWPVDADQLRAKVPPELPLDLHDGQAWLGIVPFHMTNVAPRGVPALPGLSAFPELNVRTYVTLDGKPGVYFFSLDATNPIAVAAARLLFHLPYYFASMRVAWTEDWVHYHSRRTNETNGPAALEARYRPIGPAREPQRGTLDHFLTERYCLYAVAAGSRRYRLEIHHRPWALQPAELQASVNTMADAAELALPPVPPLLHFAKRQDMVAWPLERL